MKNAENASPKDNVEVAGWIFEDELPRGYPYDAMFPHSKVDGVRLFPVFAPISYQRQTLAAYGPYKVTFLGPAVWAGITEELPPELAGEKVWLMTAGMVAFIRASVADAWDGGSMDGGRIQELAVKHGILEQVLFDPAIHRDPDDCAEPGDPWFVYTAAFKDISGAMK